MFADRRAQIEAQNRKVQAEKMTALSDLYAERDSANRQSIANYMLEQQTRFDQNRELARDAMLGKQRAEWQRDAKDMVLNDLKSNAELMAAYNASDTNLPITSWAINDPTFRQEYTKAVERANQWIIDQETQAKLNLIPGWNWLLKFGGKVYNDKNIR